MKKVERFLSLIDFEIVIGILLIFTFFFSFYKFYRIYKLRELINEEKLKGFESFIEEKKLKRFLFTGDEISNLAHLVGNWIEKNQINLENIVLIEEIKTNGLEGRKIQLEIFCSYEKLCDFIEFIRNYPKKIYIETLQISGKNNHIQASFILLLYYNIKTTGNIPKFDRIYRKKLSFF